jgi:precorrin-2 methylase
MSKTTKRKKPTKQSKASVAKETVTKLTDGGEMVVFHVEQTKKRTEEIKKKLEEAGLEFRLLSSVKSGEIKGYITYGKGKIN